MHGLVSGLALISIKSSARVRDLRCWMKLADAVIVIRISLAIKLFLVRDVLLFTV